MPAMLWAAAVTTAVAATFNFTQCPGPLELQSDRVKANFTLDSFVGTYYELALHDLTQYPACFTGPFCVRSIKTLDTERQEVNDTWSLGCVRGGPNPYNVPLRFNLTDTTGYFRGWSPVTGRLPYPDTVVDFKLSPDGGQYEWVIEFQCEQVDDKVVFTGINFYSRDYNVSEDYYQELIQAGRDAGLGIYMDHGEGLYRVPHTNCTWYNDTVAAETESEGVSETPNDLPTPGDCQCDGGDYWCSLDGYLRRNYNCSGNDDAKSYWKKISNLDNPSTADCQALSDHCELQPPIDAANSTCDNSCYDFCWKTDVGDCSDFDDENSFCVSLCQDYCLASRCGTRPLTPCEASCGDSHMKDTGPFSINFVDYSLCIAANCTSVPISPYGH
eukprot:INCI9573.2.p1 GENE.INCI9573.2~~INCI9573.2.p1  ORF type:complete len:386 (+),score=54.05 INCI9573.2:103-1260(+)